MARHANQLPGTFEERCLAQAKIKEAQAYLLPSGMEQEDMLRDARQMRIAADIEKWIVSPGLQQPT